MESNLVCNYTSDDKIGRPRSAADSTVCFVNIYPLDSDLSGG